MKTAESIREAFIKGVRNSNTEYLYVKEYDLAVLSGTEPQCDDEDGRLVKVLRSDLAKLCDIELETDETLYPDKPDREEESDEYEEEDEF